MRWKTPDLKKPDLALTEEGREKMGGLEMFVGGFPDITTGDAGVRKVGQTILPESTDRGSPRWTAQEPLLVDGQVILSSHC